MKLATERLPLAFDSAHRRRLARDEEPSERISSVMAGMAELAQRCTPDEWAAYYNKLRALDTTPAADDTPRNGREHCRPAHSSRPAA